MGPQLPLQARAGPSSGASCSEPRTALFPGDSLATCPGQPHAAVGRRPTQPLATSGNLGGSGSRVLPHPGSQRLSHYLTLLPRALHCPEGLQVPLQARSAVGWGGGALSSKA